MADVSKFSIKSQSKSVSLPSRSHPTTFEIEELLNKIKTTVAEAASAETICSGLSQLTRLYKCMDDLLTSSTTQVLMSREQNRKWVDELVDDQSVKFLDVCGSISNMLSENKDHSRNLLCVLRRRKGELSIENSIKKYNCFRKKMRKDVKGLVRSLKQVNNMISGHGLVVVDSDDHQLAAVIRVLIGVSEMTILVFESLLMFFSVPVSKTNRLSFVMSKLMHKGTVACEDQEEQTVNELESIDAALRILFKYRSLSKERNVQIAQGRLERLGTQIQSMESELESMFRCLVQSRVSLLNIISM